MNGIKPNGHEEITVNRGLILLTTHDIDMPAVPEFKTIDAYKITFNDIFVSYLDDKGAYHYQDLDKWRIKVYPYGSDRKLIDEPQEEKTLEEKQVTIFDLLGG